MAGKGGSRVGAGRKPIHSEVYAKDLATKAIVNKFGTLEAGLEFLIDSGEPNLLKFVFEHAIGKPKEKMEHSGAVEHTVITGMKVV
jgi:hypothetical protein